jgi:hypothetical protein
MKKLFIILLFVGGPGYSQVQKISKDSLAPYEGVIMPLQTYRVLRLKTIKCDTFLIVSEQKNEVQDSLINSMVQELALCDDKNKSFSRELSQKDSTIFKLNENYKKTISEIKPEKPFYLKPYVYIGALVGYLVGKL